VWYTHPCTYTHTHIHKHIHMHIHVHIHIHLTGIKLRVDARRDESAVRRLKARRNRNAVVTRWLLSEDLFVLRCVYIYISIYDRIYIYI